MIKASHIIMGTAAVNLLESKELDCKSIDRVEEVLKEFGLENTYEIKRLSDFTTEAEEKAFVAGFDEYMYLHLEDLLEVSLNEFTINDRDTYPGWHNKYHTWNGWEMPYFTLTVAREILSENGCKFSHDKGTGLIEYYNEEDMGDLHCGDYVYKAPMEKVFDPETNEELHLYRIGDGWIWDVADACSPCDL